MLFKAYLLGQKQEIQGKANATYNKKGESKFQYNKKFKISHRCRNKSL